MQEYAQLGFTAAASIALAAFITTAPAARATNVKVLIQEINPDVVITATGSLVLPSTPLGQTVCGNNIVTPAPANGAIQSSTASICLGNSTTLVNYYSITGPLAFGTGNSIAFAFSSLGTFFGIEGNLGLVGADYSSGSAINSSSLFKNQSLTSLGISQTGILGTWALLNGQTITLEAVPGPLSLLGLPVGYSWSRRLRKRIQAAK